MEHPASGATCDTAGIIQPAVQLVVAHQITEALKILVEDYGRFAKRCYRLIFGIINRWHLK